MKLLLHPKTFIYIFCRNFSQYKHKFTIKECCTILELSHSDIDLVQLKNAYILSCKRFHPDVCDDNEKFIQIENAYQILKEYIQIKEEKIAMEMQDNDNDDGDKIKHKVPQHRQYLSYDGIGYGTQSSRLKQYQTYRLNSATDAVHEFKIEKIKSQSLINEEKSMIMRDANLQRQIKTKQGFERLVEDLIQESMAKGDFDNLPGKGKPLKYKPELPYIDSTTYKLNQILINNGYVPEWVRLEREISEDTDGIRQSLQQLYSSGNSDYDKLMRQIEENVKKLNFKIDKFNSVVPILNKQKFHFLLNKEINKFKSSFSDGNNSNQMKEVSQMNHNVNPNPNQMTLIGAVLSIFKI